jgi:hypothetical protein
MCDCLCVYVCVYIYIYIYTYIYIYIYICKHSHTHTTRTKNKYFSLALFILIFSAYTIIHMHMQRRVHTTCTSLFSLTLMFTHLCQYILKMCNHTTCLHNLIHTRTHTHRLQQLEQKSLDSRMKASALNERVTAHVAQPTSTEYSTTQTGQRAHRSSAATHEDAPPSSAVQTAEYSSTHTVQHAQRTSAATHTGASTVGMRHRAGAVTGEYEDTSVQAGKHVQRNLAAASSTQMTYREGAGTGEYDEATTIGPYRQLNVLEREQTVPLNDEDYGDYLQPRRDRSEEVFGHAHTVDLMSEGVSQRRRDDSRADHSERKRSDAEDRFAAASSWQARSAPAVQVLDHVLKRKMDASAALRANVALQPRTEAAFALATGAFAGAGATTYGSSSILVSDCCSV